MTRINAPEEVGSPSLQGFWGLVVEPGKGYSQVVEAAFRVTMAALGPVIKSEKSRSCVSIEIDNTNFVACSLRPVSQEQQYLDLIIPEGETVRFSVTGDNIVHLTGYYLPPEDSNLGYIDEEEEEDDDEAPLLVPSPHIMYSDEDMEDDEDLDDEDLDEDDMDDSELDFDDDEDDDEDDDDDDEEVASPGRLVEVVEEPSNKRKAVAAAPAPAKKAAVGAEKPQPAAAAKQAAPAKQTPAKDQKAAQPAVAAKDQKKPQSATATPVKAEQAAKAATPAAKAVTPAAKAATPAAKTPADKSPAAQPAAAATPVSKTLPSGLTITDKVVGNGKKAKGGRTVAMRYIGTLENGKVFDRNVSGKPFKFRLGAGQVIKGWDLGIEGMSVGGERILNIPANLAYGQAGAPPTIPKNARLNFEVKLLDVE